MKLQSLLTLKNWVRSWPRNLSTDCKLRLRLLNFSIDRNDK